VSALRRALALSATAVVAVLGLLPGQVDARPDARAFPPARPTRVLVLGDSVIKGAVGALPAALPGREVVVDAEVSRSTGASADALAALGSDWDVVVVLLAHNDGGSPGAYQPALGRIVDQLADVRQVSLLTLHEVRPYYAEVNRHLRSLADARPNVRVGDWHAVAAANPGALAGDGLHLNGEGARLMAELVSAEVRWAELTWTTDLRRLAEATATTTTTPPPTTTAPPSTTTTAATTTTTSSAPALATGSSTTAPLASGQPVATAATPGDEPARADDGGRALLIGGSAVAWAAVATWGIRRRRRRRAG
jgi:lysophospholipase L1-like esterase